MSNKKFTGWYIPKAHTDDIAISSKDSYEQIMYVGCVHGGNEDFIRQLNRIAQNPPSLLVFTGDLTGTIEMEELKRRFYNYVANRAKPFLKEHPNSTDQELLSYIGTNPPEHNMTLQGGYLSLLGYQLELQQLQADEINIVLGEITESDIASSIRYISSFTYYGEWVATLSQKIREAILNPLEKSAESILEPIGRIRDLGARIIMVEGNWDNPRTTGVRVIAGKDITSFFETKKFFEDRGFTFIDEIATEETHTTLQVLLPYNVLLNFEDIPQTQVDLVKQRVLEARKRDKQIIVVGHAVPLPWIHNLFSAKPNKKDDTEISTLNFRRAIAMFSPDEVVYGHFHDCIKNEKGIAVDLNAKYILETAIDRDGIELIEHPDEFGKNNAQAIVTYLPLHHIAELHVPLNGSRSILSGYRQPIMLCASND